MLHEFPEQSWLTDSEVHALHARALNLLQAGQDAAGAEILLALALARPQSAVYFRDLGLAWHRGGAWEKAWEAYNVAYGLDPNDDMAAALRAECAVQLLTAPAALEILEAVLARPQSAAAGPYLARARQLHQRLRLALAAAAAVTPQTDDHGQPPTETEAAHV